MLDRRAFLRSGCLLLAGRLAAGVPATPVAQRAEAAEEAPLPPSPALDRDHAIFVDAADPSAGQYAASYNRRISVTPRLRVLCKTPHAVAVMLKWAREHAVPFALRCGGHSFEGFSRHPTLVIDTRLLNGVAFDEHEQTVHVGAGALLSDVYGGLDRHGRTIAAGYCQSVGISGLTLGGGTGYLARAAGLTCDLLRSVELVNAEGRQVYLDRQSHPDLFWACRGGGGGSFGVVTGLVFSTIAAPPVVDFDIDWLVPPIRAAEVLTAWQDWLAGAPDELGLVLNLSKHDGDNIFARLHGQSAAGEGPVAGLVDALSDRAKPMSPPQLRRLSFLEAANRLSTPGARPSAPFKYKSDVVTAPLPRQSFEELFERLTASPTRIGLTFEALGGAVSRVAADATAFPHRNGLFNMQYAARLPDEGDPGDMLGALARIHAVMRPYASGGVYVNYPDTDLEDWPRAYWGANLERLMAVKRQYDPDNVFRHAQSVPLAWP